MSRTGEIPQHLTGKLPTLQHYACLESIEINQHNHLMNSRLLHKLNQDSFSRDSSGGEDDSHNLMTTQKKVPIGIHYRVNSPVLEQ
mgnify:CR=1 FL=1